MAANHYRVLFSVLRVIKEYMNQKFVHYHTSVKLLNQHANPQITVP